MHWPRSRIGQALIAFAGATILVVLTIRPIFDVRMAMYVSQYPHDGQDSLGAAFDAIVASIFIEIVSCVLLYRLQKKLVGRRAAKVTVDSASQRQ
jgi:hypothetical protein